MVVGGGGGVQTSYRVTPTWVEVELDWIELNFGWMLGWVVTISLVFLYYPFYDNLGIY